MAQTLLKPSQCIQFHHQSLQCPEVEDEDECVFEDMDELLQIDNGETEDLIYSSAV